MICARCLRRAAASPLTTSLTSQTSRQLSQSARRLADKKPLSPNAAAQSTPQRSPPAATSTSAAQPFSTPETPSPSASGTSGAPSSRPEPAIKSSVPAGTPLKGLNYMKNGSDPIALEDHEYPDWLWTLLSERKSTESSDEGKDPRLFAKSARSRRAANKRARKAAAEKGEVEEKIPVYEQSVDLSLDGGEREGVRKGMREARRRDIKTANFLKGMG